MNKDDARKLSPAEQHERRRQVIRAHQETVQRIICGKRPEQLKMAFALWSRAAVPPTSNARPETP